MIYGCAIGVRLAAPGRLFLLLLGARARYVPGQQHGGVGTGQLG